MKKACCYFNDIKECEVIDVYEIGDFIEIVYRKNDIVKTLSIEYVTYMRSMVGMGSFFRIGGVPLPEIMRSPLPENTYVKRPSERLVGIHKIHSIQYYHLSEPYHQDAELEILYEDINGTAGQYLLYFQWNEQEDDLILSLEKDKAPVLEKIDCGEETLPNELFSVELYKQHLEVALKAHGTQQTPHGLPYSFHITSVAAEVIAGLHANPMSHDEANVAIGCALLHDVHEDTPHTLDSLINQSIRMGVDALTKNTSLATKPLQMQDSLERLKIQPKCVQMVKLADRITNLNVPPIFWDRSKKIAYRDEAQNILDVLRNSSPYLANRLQSRINDYQDYIDSTDDYLIFSGEDKIDDKTLCFIMNKNESGFMKRAKALIKLNNYLFDTYEHRLFKSRYSAENYFSRDITFLETNIKEYFHPIELKELITIIKGFQSDKNDKNIAKLLEMFKNG